MSALVAMFALRSKDVYSRNQGVKEQHAQNLPHFAGCLPAKLQACDLHLHHAEATASLHSKSHCSDAFFCAVLCLAVRLVPAVELAWSSNYRRSSIWQQRQQRRQQQHLVVAGCGSTAAAASGQQMIEGAAGTAAQQSASR
jgi:hypothetical protein